MNRRPQNNKKISVNQVLLFVLFFVFLLVVAGTVVAFISGIASPGANLRRADPSPNAVERRGNKKNAVYEELGRLRAVTADNPPVSVVISPFFPYPENDREFYEELVKKNRQLRALILEYFAQYTAQDLRKKTESAVKQELIELINGQLVLGRLTDLYFSEYLFL